MKQYWIGIFLGFFFIWAQEPEIVTRQREKIAEYQKALESIRGQTFQQNVLVSYKTEEEVKSFLTSMLHEEISDTLNASLSQAFLSLDLVSAPFDYRNNLMALFTSQIAAFYDPKQKTFFFVMLDLPADQLAPIVVHELHHGLQDQYYNLDKILRTSSQNHSEDLQVATRLWVEGEATFSMSWYALKEFYPKQFSPKFLMSTLYFQEKLSRDAVAEQYLNSPSSWMQNAGKILQTIPDYFYHALYDPYNLGAVLIGEMHQYGGWELVHQLFKDPPTTTEQVLHWKEKFIHERDFPTTFSFSLPHLLWTLSGQGREMVPTPLEKITQEELLSRWRFSVRNQTAQKNPFASELGYCQLLLRTSFGEFGLRSVLQQFSQQPALSKKAAEGWDGDTFLLFKTNEQNAFLWMLTFDTENDASEAKKAFLPLIENWKKKHPNLSYLYTRKEKDILLTATNPLDAELFHQTAWDFSKKREEQRPFYEEKQMCSDCQSLHVVPIVYGLPQPEDAKLVEAGKIFLGGCIIPNPAPYWRCFECFQQWE